MIKILEINLNLPAKSSPEKSIREHTDELLSALENLKKLGYISDERVYKLCKHACEYHDYGKVNHEFQERLKTRKKFDPANEIAHNLLSVPLVEKNELSDDDFATVLNAVINHHHYTDNIGFLQDNKEQIYEKLADWNYSKVKSSIIKKMINLRETPLAIFVQGVLLKCDYSASGGIEIEFQNDFLRLALERVFESFTINPMQKFCAENMDKNLIITAPTGMGKTEASLLWLGDNKGFYILPLKTAINSMYLRICENILNNDDIETKVALLHSDSMSVILKNQLASELDIFDYVNLGKRFSLPITVCTPDQIFDFVFKYGGYELKLATLSYSKVIIDEIQAYNAELLSYVIYGIHQIIKMGGSIAIFTATLPPYILALIEKPYEISPFIKADFSSEQAKIRHNVKVIDSEISATFIYETFLKNIEKDSNKALVVCNTVKNAQKIYKELVEKFGDECVKLLHAKFTKNDRASKEKQILEDGRSEVKKTIIWVSTQIVEASLDIDFDFIFTELSELSGLFQRLGRCNRKGLKSTNEYNCYIFTKISEHILISKYDSNKGFIDKDIYNLSKIALEHIDGILTEEEKTQLLEAAFTYENLKDSLFIKEYNSKYKYVSDIFVDDSDHTEVDRRFRRIISKNIIPSVVYEENEDVINEALETLQAEKNDNFKELILDKQRAKNIIEGFCVSVNPYDVQKGDLVKTIKLNKFTNIEIVDCTYDDKVGFVKKKKTADTNEDNTGLFF